MMKISLLLVSLFGVVTLFAQDSGYSVYYVSTYDFDASVLQKAVRSEQKTEQLKRMALANQIKNRLIVSDSSSFYYHFKGVDPLKKATLFTEEPIHHSLFGLGDSAFTVDYYRDTCIISFAAKQYNWNLTDYYKTISGNKCQLAWTLSPISDTIFAYYAIDLTYKEGPFYYRGLPGIIMEVFDLSTKWYYTAEKTSKGLYTIQLPPLNVITLEEYNEKRNSRNK